MPTSFYRKAKKVCVLFISLHTDINRLNFVECRMYNKCRLVDCMIFLKFNWSWFATSHGHQGHGSSVCYFVFFLVFTVTFSYPFLIPVSACFILGCTQMVWYPLQFSQESFLCLYIFWAYIFMDQSTLLVVWSISHQVSSFSRYLFQVET